MNTSVNDLSEEADRIGFTIPAPELVGHDGKMHEDVELSANHDIDRGNRRLNGSEDEEGFKMPQSTRMLSMEIEDPATDLGFKDDDVLTRAPYDNESINGTQGLEKWNRPAINILRVFAATLSFLLAGLNDASVGSLVPILERHYDISYSTVSLAFLSPFVGYLSASMLCSFLHKKFGMRGTVMLGNACLLAAFSVTMWAPPFWILVCFYSFTGFGISLNDAAFNTWSCSLADTNELMGILHASFGLGAALAPLTVSGILKAGHEWNYYYFVLCMIVLSITTVIGIAFWKEDATKYSINRKQQGGENFNENDGFFSDIQRALKNNITWKIALFLFFYVGSEVTIGGWTLTYLIDILGGEETKMRNVVAGFWIGITLGRLILGFLTGKMWGEKVNAACYLATAIVLDLILISTTNILTAAVVVFLLGFMYGPLFPTAVVVCTRIMPKELHIPSVSFAAALSGAGAALFPFITGVLNEHYGSGSVCWVAIISMVSMLGIWLSLPDPRKRIV